MVVAAILKKDLCFIGSTDIGSGIDSGLIVHDHREIIEERKSGKIIGEIRIGPKMYYCAGAALNVVFHHFLN